MKKFTSECPVFLLLILMSNFTQEEFETLYETVEEFVPYKFFVNLFDEMSYHGYNYESIDVDDIVQISFNQSTTTGTTGTAKPKRSRRVVAVDDSDGVSVGEIDTSRINVLLIFHEKQNKHHLLSRKSDFDKNIRRYIVDGIENIVVFDSEDVEKSIIKHTKGIVNAKFTFRGADSYICNINNVIPKGFSIASESEVKAIESMRVLPSLSSVLPYIDEDNVICRMMRVKKGGIIKYEELDPAVKSFTVKYFLVR